jgi:DNA-directed RNA polymerase specialized sigma24 family protein
MSSEGSVTRWVTALKGGDSEAAQPLRERYHRQLIALARREQPTPEFAAQLAEQYERLLDVLADDSLRRVAVWKMEGYSNDEVAERLDCSRRTVARKLETMRILWSNEAAP